MYSPISLFPSFFLRLCFFAIFLRVPVLDQLGQICIVVAFGPVNAGYEHRQLAALPWWWEGTLVMHSAVAVISWAGLHT